MKKLHQLRTIHSSNRATHLSLIPLLLHVVCKACFFKQNIHGGVERSFCTTLEYLIIVGSGITVLGGKFEWN